MSRVEVMSGPERRWRWSEDQKRAIVAEACAAGGTVRGGGPACGWLYRYGVLSRNDSAVSTKVSAPASTASRHNNSISLSG